ncbi:MAG: hypothetical protein V1900_00140 [Candidatus Aenigmatarchaeota archaeon]
MFKMEKDWKQLLANEDEARMNEILRKVAKYRGAYRNADDIRAAQLWCAVLELQKEILSLNKRLIKLEDLLDGMLDRVRKQEDEKRKIVESLEMF